MKGSVMEARRDGGRNAHINAIPESRGRVYHVTFVTCTMIAKGLRESVGHMNRGYWSLMGNLHVMTLNYMNCPSLLSRYSSNFVLLMYTDERVSKEKPSCDAYFNLVSRVARVHLVVCQQIGSKPGRTKQC